MGVYTKMTEIRNKEKVLEGIQREVVLTFRECPASFLNSPHLKPKSPYTWEGTSWGSDPREAEGALCSSPEILALIDTFNKDLHVLIRATRENLAREYAELDKA